MPGYPQHRENKHRVSEGSLRVQVPNALIKDSKRGLKVTQTIGIKKRDPVRTT